jgi:hypothetical protein
METQLAILLDGLKKKEAALTEIVNITENQRTVIESGLPLPEVREFLTEMNKEKQIFIEQVKGCDSMFEAMLKEIGPELDARQDMYKPQVAQLQIHIRRVMDLDVKVRVQEEKNHTAMNELAPPPPAIPGIKPKPKLLPTDNARVIKAYEQEKRFRG